MRTKMILTAVIGASLLMTGAVAQQPAQCGNGNMANMACCNNMAGMSGMTHPGMSQMMPGMAMNQNETAKLVDQLVNSLAAIEAEKNPKARKEKLAAHGALLKELQAKLQAHSEPPPAGQ